MAWTAAVAVLFYCINHGPEDNFKECVVMKFVNKKLATACILSVMCAGFASLGYAAEEKTQKEEIQSFALDEYVVTANRTEQTIFNANANISVVTSADIERMHYDTLDKALTAVPGVQFENYSGAAGLNYASDAPIRINGSKNVLILVDGVRMTPVGSGDRAIKASLLNNMDNVERIEVLKGAAGVLYGSDAAGGVINIITKKGNENKTTLKATTGSFGKEAYHFSNSGTDNDLSWHVYYDKDRKGDFKDGLGNTIDNYYDSHAAGIKLDQKVGDKHLFTFKYDESDAEFRATGALKGTLAPQRGDLYSQETVFTHKWDMDDNTTNVLIYRTGRIMPAYQTYGNSWKPGVGVVFGWGTINGTAYKTRTISDQFTKQFDDNHTLVFGFDINKTKAGTWNSSTDLNDKNLSWNGNIKNNSYFIQDTWTFDEKWNATAGVRYDAAKSSGYVNVKENDIIVKRYSSGEMDKNFSKSLNIAHKFDDRNNIYVAYDEYFIIPTADEIYGKKYGNAALEPAKGKNYSIGYNHIIDNNSSISVHAFQRKADVSIGLVKVDDNQNQNNIKYANYENAKDIGFDIQYNKRFDEKWNAFVGYSFLKHTSDALEWNDRTKLGYLPRHAVNLGVNYTYDKWDIGVTGRGFLSRDDGAEITHASDVPNFVSDHYWVFNIGANYQATKNIKLFASANNIFDTHYAEAASQGPNGDLENYYYAMPGRNYVAGVEVSF